MLSNDEMEQFLSIVDDDDDDGIPAWLWQLTTIPCDIRWEPTNVSVKKTENDSQIPNPIIVWNTFAADK